MSADVLDLDVLRPKSRLVKIGGFEIDVSFVPVALTWDVQEIVDELMQYTDNKKIQESREVQEKLLHLSCRLCGVFASWQHKELTADWFQNHADASQVGALVEEIKNTLVRAYEGVEAYQGNAKAARSKSR